ncbi:enoyl-[acyl-carrier-protein] reductase, mitochondrial-like [Babylonia areolata]|uniref:enoyl-[acyl-carrier-protein] reductase, mitochondrial-like n=1 Tax=Babylonia areolata TaxID=304850 RepID=UPI003FD25022
MATVGRLRLLPFTARKLNVCTKCRDAVYIPLIHQFSQNSTRNLSSFQIIYESHGDPRKVLTDRTVPVQLPLKEDEVLVKMKLAPVNPSDINMVEGTYFIRPPLPAVVGNEGVGEVVEVGSAVRQLRVGDWVNPADSGWGTWRSHAVSREGDVSRVPNDIPVLGAATLVVNPCTAYRMLKDYVQLKAGDVVMQNSANSAVGQAVIQLARQWNVTTVNVVRNRPDFQDLEKSLKSLGADHVITDEFCRSPEMKDFMKSLSAAPKLALNGVGGKSATELLRNLAQGGTMVTYGGMSRQPVTVPTGALIFKEVRVVGYWNTEWNKRHIDSPLKQEMVTELCDLMRTGKFQSPSADVYSLCQYKEAVAAATEGFKGKKVVLKME